MIPMTRMAITILRCNGLDWVQVHPHANIDVLGFIPEFLSVDDPRRAHEQINERYCSGWHSFKGFRMLDNGNLAYPGDTDTRLMYISALRNERLFVYEHAWVAVVQPDGSFDVARLD